MFRPSLYARQTAGSTPGRPTGFFKNPNSNVWMGVVALVAVTSLVYWAGYAAEDKRLERREAKGSPSKSN